jgi:hypothetical protein
VDDKSPGLRPWPRLRPQKTVGALHVSKSFGVFADDKSMVARHDGGGHQPLLARGRGELVKPLALKDLCSCDNFSCVKGGLRFLQPGAADP